jgi:hypothetical protein
MPKKLGPAVDLMAFKCRTLKVNNSMVTTAAFNGNGTAVKLNLMYGKYRIKNYLYCCTAHFGNDLLHTNECTVIL